MSLCDGCVYAQRLVTPGHYRCNGVLSHPEGEAAKAVLAKWELAVLSGRKKLVFEAGRYLFTHGKQDVPGWPFNYDPAPIKKCRARRTREEALRRERREK